MNPSVQSGPEAGDGDLSIARLAEEERGGLSVALSDGTVFEVAGDAPELRDLEPHRPLTVSQLDGLRLAAARREIARRVFGWLDRRAYAKGRLRKKLLELEYDADAIEAVLEQFERNGLVDDEAFARLFLATQLRKRPVGFLWLLAKLRDQGVDRTVAESVVSEELSPEVELELARRALAKRATDEEPTKSLRFLAGRGFRAGTARRAAAERFHRDVEAGE